MLTAVLLRLCGCIACPLLLPYYLMIALLNCDDVEESKIYLTRAWNIIDGEKELTSIKPLLLNYYFAAVCIALKWDLMSTVDLLKRLDEGKTLSLISLQENTSAPGQFL